jgi:hypothetical protein
MVDRSLALTACPRRQKQLLGWRWMKRLVDPRTVNRNKTPQLMEWSEKGDADKWTMATQAVS